MLGFRCAITLGCVILLRSRCAINRHPTGPHPTLIAHLNPSRITHPTLIAHLNPSRITHPTLIEHLNPSRITQSTVLRSDPTFFRLYPAIVSHARLCRPRWSNQPDYTDQYLGHWRRMSSLNTILSTCGNSFSLKALPSLIRNPILQSNVTRSPPTLYY